MQTQQTLPLKLLKEHYPIRTTRTKKMSSSANTFVTMNTSLAISAGFIGFCCILAEVGRCIVARTIHSDLVKELLNEAIAAAELCACCFELIIGRLWPLHSRSRFRHLSIKIFKRYSSHFYIEFIWTYSYYIYHADQLEIFLAEQPFWLGPE